uniref:PAN domain protein n=1 Tax=Rhabditophanes sp. KR3021 TaxID=114890 RepID=A0AC35TW76_9BILA
MLPSIGYSFAVFDSECYKLQLQFDSEVANQLKSAKIQSFDTKSFGTSFVEESPPPNPFQSETVKNLPPNSFQSKTIENPPPLPKPLPVIGRSNLIQPITTSSMILSKAQTTQQIIPILLDCADGSRATISITDGIQVQQQVAFYSLVLEDTDKCLYACRTSADLDGIRLPQQCRSSSYRRSTRQCLFYSDVLKPSGNLDYLPNRDSVYFEKFCIPKREVNVGCDEAVYKYPQNILLGHATEVIDSPNQADCITKCITSQQRYKFACKSVMYFHMFDKFNCILNEHDKDSKPEFMHTELRQQVPVYKKLVCKS